MKTAARLRLIYYHHFKLVWVGNLALSLFFTYLFFLKGFERAPLYSIALAFKLVGYATTLAIERLFFNRRVYYYKNIGLGYRKIFTVFFTTDLLIFTVFLIICGLCRSFM